MEKTTQRIVRCICIVMKSGKFSVWERRALRPARYRPRDGNDKAAQLQALPLLRRRSAEPQSSRIQNMTEYSDTLHPVPGSM